MSRRAVGAIAIVVVVVIAVAAVGVLFVTNQPSPNTSASLTAVSTVVVVSQSSSPTTTSSASTTSECYQEPLPSNTSESGGQSVYRTVFNITQQYNSFSWALAWDFAVGPYAFSVSNPGAASNPGVVQLEPQLFINVTNSQIQVQKIDLTSMPPALGGNTYPDRTDSEITFFGGNATIQWLFPCNSQSAFWEVTTK
jgi:hypothetical protein